MNIFERAINAYLKRKHPIKYAKKMGVNIADSVRLVGVTEWGSEPWLITVGENTTFSDNVHVITHDGGVSVARREEKYKML